MAVEAPVLPQSEVGVQPSPTPDFSKYDAIVQSAASPAPTPDYSKYDAIVSAAVTPEPTPPPNYSKYDAIIHPDTAESTIALGEAPVLPDHSAQWNATQKQMAEEAAAAGLPPAPNGNARLIDAIQRSHAAGYTFPHFSGPDAFDPKGDRTVTLDMEALTRSLAQQETDAKDPQEKKRLAREKDYWANQSRVYGMTAEQWKQQTGESDPIPSKPFILKSPTQVDLDEARMVREGGPLVNLPTAKIYQTDPWQEKAGKAAYNTASGFINGVTGTDGVMMMINPFVGLAGLGATIPDLINKVKQAELTQPNSPERWQAGSDVVAFMALPAVAHAALKGKPNAIQIGSAKTEIPRPVEGGQAIPADSGGVGSGEQGLAPAGPQTEVPTGTTQEAPLNVPSSNPITTGGAAETAPSTAGKVLGESVRSTAPDATAQDVAAPGQTGTEEAAGQGLPQGTMSVGGAIPEEFMRRYALAGASELVKGNTEPHAFNQAIEKEFGSHIREHLPEIRQRAEAVVNEFQSGTGKSEMAQEINRQVGIAKVQEHPVRMRLFAALKASLKTAERAGQAGYKRGVKEATAAGTEKVRQMREKARTADAWLAADAAEIRDNLIEYSKNLPLHERGKFISAITSALRRTPLWSSDIGVMYRRAEAVLNRMTESLYNVEKKAVTKAIEERVDKILNSPSVSVAQKQAVRQIQTTFNAMKDKMSFDMLQRMHESILELERTGKDLFVLDQTVRDLKTQAALREITAGDVRKVDRPVPTRVGIGETKGAIQKKLDMIRNSPNLLRHFNLSWTPMDFIFQTFDQTFNGPLYRTMKLPVDTKFSAYLDVAHAYKERLSQIVKANQLTEGALNRIYAVAELRQEGGLENMQALGYSEKELKDIRLTKGEQEYLKAADAINDELFPKIKDVMEKDYNQELEKVPGYFPRQRDWDFYNGLSIDEGKFARAMNRTNTEKGFTISRIGATTKNIINAHEVMMNHIDDSVYHTIMGPEIRRVADVVRSEEFKNAVGTWGQRVFSDWTDVLARNGGIESGRKIHALDVIRKNVGAAQLAFRITTTALQPLAIIDGMGYVPAKTMSGSVTRMASKVNRDWILKNFPEVRTRVADDPAYTDYGSGSVRDKLARVGFKGISVLDRFAALTVADGAYRDFLHKKGIPFDPANVNPEAVQYAQQIVRKSQSTASPKDLPLALSRGEFSGNASVDKALGQFQNFMIRRWASLKNDGLQMGIKEKSASAGARVLAFTVLATVFEQLGREGIRQLTATVFGPSKGDQQAQKDEPSVAIRILENSAVDFATSVPVVSNVAGMIRYDNSGIPIVDVPKKATKGVSQVISGKHAETKAKGAIRAAQGAAALAGVPGAGQAGDLLIRWIGTEQEKPSPLLPNQSRHQIKRKPMRGQHP